MIYIHLQGCIQGNIVTFTVVTDVKILKFLHCLIQVVVDCTVLYDIFKPSIKQTSYYDLKFFICCGGLCHIYPVFE